MKKILNNKISNLIKVLIAVLALFLFNIGKAGAVTFEQGFPYTGGQQTLTVPYSGTYRFMVWGASGGNYNDYNGGYGGFSVGTIKLKKGEVLYINVGGAGSGNGSHSNWAGGYNGGGSVTVNNDGNQRTASGGGATHIATASGQLHQLNGNRNSVLIVAGGGGGAGGNSFVMGTSGGHGGGYIGGNSTAFTENGITHPISTGGTQTGGGSGEVGTAGFGYGLSSWNSGGGGGWFGGGAGWYTAGGGSGYIGNPRLISSEGYTKHMVGYGVATSTAENTRTYSTSCADANQALYDCTRIGPGAALITLLKSGPYLDSLTVSKGSIKEQFDSEKFNYTWIIPKGVTELTDEDITAIPMYQGVTVVVPESVPFTQDGDTFEIQTIEEGGERYTYTLTMQRYVSNDGKLASITSDKGVFKEVFDPTKKNYTLEIYEDADTVTLDAEPNEQDNQGITGIGEIELDSHEKDVEIISTAEDGTIEVYNVHIIKNMYLKDIKIEGLDDLDCEEGQCSMTPEFDKTKENYTMYIPIEYFNLNVSYVPSDEDLTVGVRVNEVSYVPGYKLQRIKNVVKFNIYNDSNNIVKSYSVTLIRDNKESGKLKDLVVNKGYLLEDFHKNKYDYSWVIPKGVNQLTKDDVTVKLFDTASTAVKPEVVSFTEDGDKYIVTVKIKENVDFGYTGGQQTFTAPYTGAYKLETWGASGGNYNGYLGGFGGYSVGAVDLTAGDVLYINVGGYGVGYGGHQNLPGGYNGGGSVVNINNDGNQRTASGGGATHIATASGLLSQLSGNRNSILIVSGGGGAAGGNIRIMGTSGGQGGGYIGGNSSIYTEAGRSQPAGAGGTQTGGGSGNIGTGGFGIGSSSWNSGGGGGYFGGGVSWYSAGGGSGYVGNSKLVSYDSVTKHMTCYYCATSSAESTRTISTSLHSATPIADYAKEGHGYARITLLDANTITKTYTLTMQREISDDARLATLTADKGLFTEEFDKDKYEYVLEMYHKETSVTLDATPFEQDATVIDGLGEIDLPTDETEHTITVQAENGTIKVYTIIIRRNMYIEDLGLNGLDGLYCKSDECHMTPEFRPEVIDYEFRVPLDYNILDAYYEPASAEHRSEMTINGKPYVDNYKLPSQGTTVVQVHVYNDNDEIVKTYTMNVIKYYKYIEEFNYTGNYQAFIAPRTGHYKLDTWGAQGGSQTGIVETNGYSSSVIGGYGGYSTGYVFLEKGEILYVYVGGQGGNVTSRGPGGTGGYNGGGAGGAAFNTNFVGSAGGGGATHIATKTGLLSSLSSSRNDILIVSGGGGGASWIGASGSGGGYIGGSVTYGTTTVSGGTQTAGYAFGQGQNGIQGYDGPGDCEGTGGGGGGFYGGYASQARPAQSATLSGGGGSGYIANSELQAYEDSTKHMTCYNCSTSNEVDTKTMSNTCHSATPTVDCSKEGNGYSKIKLEDTETMLASLDVDSVNIVEPFDKFRTEYTWIIPKGTDDFTSDNVTATLLHPEKAHIEWPSEPVHFNQDGDKFTFKVVADNGEEDTYILTMIREKSSENRLKTLESNKGVFTPEFNPDTNSYVLEIFEYLDEVTLTGEPMSEYSTVVGLGTIDMEEDIVEHEIIVTAEDGSINIYNVTIKKDAYLLYLGLNGLDSVPCVEDECTLVPPFEPSSNEYSIKVPYGYETLDVYYLTSTPEHSVKIKVNGSEVSNYSLPEGDTLVTVELYNKNNILVNTYTMNVNRAKGNYATLDNLEVSTGDLNISFDRETTEYTWIIPFDVSNNLEEYLTYSTTDPGAIAELIPSTINYTGDGQTFDIKVTAEDGVTTKTYTITLQQDIIEDIEVDENMFITVGETKNLYINGLPDGCVGKYLYEVDQSAVVYVYDNGDVYGIYPGTTDVTISVKNHPEITPKVVHVTVVSDKITSSILDVLDKDLARIIIGEEPGVNISDFLDKLDNPREYLEVYDKDDNLISSDDYESINVKTGIKVKLVIEGNLHDEAIIIIRGDINEDGLVNVIDKSILSEHVLRLNNIEGYRTYAADVDNNDSINVVDKSKISEYLLRLIDSLNE